MIYVFKTTVKTNVQAKSLKPHPDKLLPKAKWNFDLDDCENVLCIDSEENIILPIINVLKDHNFDWQELE